MKTLFHLTLLLLLLALFAGLPLALWWMNHSLQLQRTDQPHHTTHTPHPNKPTSQSQTSAFFPHPWLT